MVKNYRKATKEEAVGTGFKCYLDITYQTLRNKLGKPHYIGSSDGKVEVEWDLKFKDGTVITIYDYKVGKSYLGKGGKPVSAIKEWNVGGRGGVIKNLRMLFPRSKITTREKWR